MNFAQSELFPRIFIINLLQLTLQLSQKQNSTKKSLTIVLESILFLRILRDLLEWLFYRTPLGDFIILYFHEILSLNGSANNTSVCYKFYYQNTKQELNVLIAYVLCYPIGHIKVFTPTPFMFFQLFYADEKGLGTLYEKCPNAELLPVQIQENTDQKKICIWTLFTQWYFYLGLLGQG